MLDSLVTALNATHQKFLSRHPYFKVRQRNNPGWLALQLMPLLESHLTGRQQAVKAQCETHERTSAPAGTALFNLAILCAQCAVLQNLWNQPSDLLQGKVSSLPCSLASLL